MHINMCSWIIYYFPLYLSLPNGFPKLRSVPLSLLPFASPLSLFMLCVYVFLGSGERWEEKRGERKPKRQRAHSKLSPHETEEMELYVSLCCLINRNLMDKD